jgi:hypothetical protein
MEADAYGGGATNGFTVVSNPSGANNQIVASEKIVSSTGTAETEFTYYSGTPRGCIATFYNSSGPVTHYSNVSSSISLSSTLTSQRQVSRILSAAIKLLGGPIGVKVNNDNLRLISSGASISMSSSTSYHFQKVRTLIANFVLSAAPRVNFIRHQTITGAGIKVSSTIPYCYRAVPRTLTGNMKLASTVSPHRILSRAVAATIFLKSSVQSFPARFRTVTGNIALSSTVSRQVQAPRTATGNMSLSSTLASKRILARFVASNIAIASTLTSLFQRAGAFALKIGVTIRQRGVHVRVRQRGVNVQVKKREVKEET